MADHSNLKMWQEAAAATKDCLPVEMLERLAEDASADPKAAAHLAGCAHCQTELEMLKSFEAATPSENEGAAVAWIVTQLERRQQGDTAKAPAMARVPFWRNLLRIPYLAGAAALAAVLVLGISLYHSDSGTPHLSGPGGQVGTYRTGEIRLLSPAGDLPRVPEEFRWEAVPEAASYKVELTDVIGKVLASATSAQPQLTATTEMRTSMQPGVPLKWKVTAFDASGKSMAESSGGTFKVAAGR